MALRHAWPPGDPASQLPALNPDLCLFRIILSDPPRSSRSQVHWTQKPTSGDPHPNCALRTRWGEQVDNDYEDDEDEDEDEDDDEDDDELFSDDEDYGESEEDMDYSDEDEDGPW